MVEVNPLSAKPVGTQSFLVNGSGLRVPLEQTANRADRRRGLLGRDSVIGVLLIDKCRSVHTVGMRFALDVAFVSLNERSLTINSTVSMPTGRFGLPRFGSNAVLEAQAGEFSRWNLQAGQRWTIES
jgi:uncharacterized protein